MGSAGVAQVLRRQDESASRAMFGFFLNMGPLRLVELLTIGGMHVPKSIRRTLPAARGAIRMHDSDATPSYWEYKPGLRPFPWRHLPLDYMPKDPFAFFSARRPANKYMMA